VAQQQYALTAAPPRRRRHTWLLVAALLLTGLSMRTAVTSVGAVLDDLQEGLHTTSGIAGLITTLPVVCFAAMGATAPRLSRRFGAHRVLIAAMSIMTVGLVLRALVSDVWAFVLLSVLALAGGAISNVLLPTIVKRHFPDRIGPMTAVYTSALALGTTAAAGLTVPIGSLGDGWRTGLGSWAVLAGLAVLPWLPTLSRDRPETNGTSAVQHVPIKALLRSRTAWALTICFAFQSFQAYITFGWFAKFMHSHGIANDTAGWMVALVAAMSVPAAMVAPSVPPRHHRPLLVGLTACYVIAYAGLTVAPVGGAWVWMVICGVGSGMFPLVLTLIGLRSRTPETTAGLSAFVQSIGYIVAGAGPLLFGVLHGVTGGWGVPLALLWIGMAVSALAGWFACAPRYVDDELTRSSTRRHHPRATARG
jgi:CP family cyanate transporter-like MFS transporter